MKVYEIEASYGWNGNTRVTKNVLAKDASEAVAFFVRFADKSYWSNLVITNMRLVVSVDVHYKAATKKKRK